MSGKWEALPFYPRPVTLKPMNNKGFHHRTMFFDAKTRFGPLVSTVYPAIDA